MADIITFVTENWTTILNGATQIVGGFALLATLTPNQSDDRIVKVIFDAINFLGGNIGKAKNG